MTTATINQNMTVREIMTLVPSAADIMIEYGLHCFSCSVGGIETLSEGCQMHGFDADTIEALVEDINNAATSLYNTSEKTLKKEWKELGDAIED